MFAEPHGAPQFGCGSPCPVATGGGGKGKHENYEAAVAALINTSGVSEPSLDRGCFWTCVATIPQKKIGIGQVLLKLKYFWSDPILVVFFCRVMYCIWDNDSDGMNT